MLKERLVKGVHPMESSGEKQYRLKCTEGLGVSRWSCYSDCAYWDGNICTKYEEKPKPKVTNYDRIKAMDIEEMTNAIFKNGLVSCTKNCPLPNVCIGNITLKECRAKIKQWLESDYINQE